MLQAGALQHAVGGDLGQFHHLDLIHGVDLAVLHQNFAVDDGGAHVRPAGKAGDAVHRHVERHQVGFEQVNQDHVGFFACFKRANLGLKSECFGRVNGHHFKHLAVRQHARVTKMAAVVMHGLEHVAEHVVAAVGCGAV